MDSFIAMLNETLGVGYHILVWGVGILAMFLSTLAFQFKKRFSIIICSFLGQTSWVLYFLLQADLVSALSCAVCAVMLALFSMRDKWQWAVSKVSIALFIILISGFSVLSFKVWSDIFPILAGIFAVLAGSREDEQSLRLLSVLWCFFWLLNSTFKAYPVAFANDLFCTVSAIIALVRYRKKTDEKA